MAWFGAPLLFGQAGDEIPGPSGFGPTVFLAVAALPILMPTPGRGGEDVLPPQVVAVPGDEGTFAAARAVPGWSKIGLHQYQYDQQERLPLQGDEGSVAPRVRSGPAYTVSVHRPAGGYSTVPTGSIVVDEGEYAVPAPVLSLPVTASPWQGLPDEMAPIAAFAGQEDVGSLYVFTGPASRLQLPPSGGYSTDLPVFGLTEESEYQVTVPPWPLPVVLPPWRYQPDERIAPPPSLAVDEGEYAPPPPIRWLTPVPPPIDGDERVTPPPTFPADEGVMGPMMYVGPRYRVLLPPPTGGYSTPAPFLLDEEGYQPVPLLTWSVVRVAPWDGLPDERVEPPAPFALDEDGFIVAPLVPFGEPVLYLDSTEATPWLWQEDYPPPLPVVPWFARVPLPWIWEQDQVGTPPAPLANDEGAYPVPVPPAPLPVVLPQPQGNDDRPLFLFSEDYGWSPRVKGGPAYTVWVHRPAGGYSTERVVVDEGTYEVPPPLPVPIRSVDYLWQEDQRVEPPAPFWLIEDLDPGMLARALPPVWRVQRTPVAFWEVEEARVNPATASGAHGTGRTHLFLGQISNDPIPQSGAAELYVLTGGYGQAVGTDTPLLVETPEIAPLGQQGRLRLRRIALPFQYEAGCTLTITPVVDFNTALPPLIVTYGDPGEPTRALVQMKVMQACTTVRLRITVTARTGRVEVYTPSIFFTPLTGGTTLALGGTT